MRGFNQVARVTATTVADENVCDPLSMFAVEKELSPIHGVDAPLLSGKQTPQVPVVESAVTTLRQITPLTQPRKSSAAASTSVRVLPTPTKSLSPGPLATETNQALGVLLDDGIPLLSGEYTIISLLEASVQLLSYGDIACALYMTNFRLAFLPLDQRAQKLYSVLPSLSSWLQVPLSCVDKLEREKRPKDGPGSGLSLVIHCKDCRQLRVTIKAKSSSNVEYDVERAYSVMAAYSFPNNLRHLFAFSHKPTPPFKEFTRQSGEAPPRDLLLEFARLGVLDSPLWRVTKANAFFKLCGTYPSLLVVPSSTTDDDLTVIAGFRSGQRLPAMCWYHAGNGATLWRSSQPKVGKSGSCGPDERMLDLVARSGSIYRAQANGGSGFIVADSTLFIVDCRSRTSAMANYAAGAGYESQSNYPNSRLEFYGIPNIHAVRDSLKALSSILLNPTTSVSSDISFSKQIEDCSWLSNLRLILRAGWETASALLRGTPVLVHCSHGWDRTAQVCCIAELLLDPFYRTMEGFPVLIEKEWCSFGHPFQMRCGHGQERNNGRQDDEMSPIFLQFLDCLYQLHKQCAHAFEFNSRYILTIAEHIYSARFGNFLFNCDHDRAVYKSGEQCADMWTFLKSNRDAFANPLYLPDVGLNCSGSTHQLPVLSQLMRGVVIWSDFFLRFSSALSQPPLPDSLAQCITTQIRTIESSADVANFMMDRSCGQEADFGLSRRVVTQSDSWEALFVRESQAKILAEGRYEALLAKLQHLCNSYPQSAEDLLREVQALVTEDCAGENVAQGPGSDGFQRTTVGSLHPQSVFKSSDLALDRPGGFVQEASDSVPRNLSSDSIDAERYDPVDADSQSVEHDGMAAITSSTKSYNLSPSPTLESDEYSPAFFV